MTSAQAEELQTAIQQGNIEQSQLIARQLAEAKANVIIRIDDGSSIAITPGLADTIRCSIILKFPFIVDLRISRYEYMLNALGLSILS